MLGSLIKFVVMVGISAFLAVILVSQFDDFYQDLEERRYQKWVRKHSRESHPSNSGPRYE